MQLNVKASHAVDLMSKVLSDLHDAKQELCKNLDENAGEIHLHVGIRDSELLVQLKGEELFGAPQR
jgi:hypothetical protein